MGRSLLCALVLLLWLPRGVTAHHPYPEDIKQLPQCRYCGMDRKHFARSRMVLEHKGHVRVGVCSINCAAVDYIRDLNDPPRVVRVGDYKTGQLIDAEKAFWVIGGSKAGVMAERAKWAFEKEADAEAFIRDYGGARATFEQAMRASYEDMCADMIKLKQMKLEQARYEHSKNPTKAAPVSIP